MPHFDNSISGFTNDALDANYKKATQSMFEQIFAITHASNSALVISLGKLDEEAVRLEEADETMQPDNAQLVQTLSVYEDTLDTTASLINANALTIQQSGQSVAAGAVTSKVFIAIATAIAASGINPVTSLAVFVKQLATTSITWVIPSATQIAASFVNSTAWIAKMNGWGAGYANLTQNTLISGIIQGWGPIKTASVLTQQAQGIPLSAAQNLTRTLQLTSYRQASLGMELANSDFIDHKIRIASLDSRTCSACVALHGTKLALGERVDDHYRGRCTEFYVVQGGPRLPGIMQADSTPGNRVFVPFQSGPSWFNSLSPQRQAQQAGFLASPAALRAFQAGTPLSAFVGSNVDPVFGNQVITTSLVGALGDDAAQYYTVNQ